MTIDIFEDEQKIFDNATALIDAVKNGAEFDFEEYKKITKEYGRMLKQLRRTTRIADRTTIDLHSSNIDLSDKIHYDALTGIYNRRYLDENLKRVVRSLARSGGSLGVLMIDIDFFKNYNDGYGHDDGDECLKAVSQTISACLYRADDFVARYGGEEFAVVLPDTDESGVRVMAKKMVEAVRGRNLRHEYCDVTDYVTISAGATASIVLQEHSGTDFLKRADEALYISKANGRNRYTYMDYGGKHEI
jgi:diguanylate cyclase (GGDEF)-like protein